MNSSKNNYKAANKLSVYIAKTLNYEALSRLEEKYSKIVTEYTSTPKFKVLSIIKIDKLQSARDWFVEIEKSKDLSIPFLVSKMLYGDIYALNIFDSIHKNTKNDLVITYQKIHSNSFIEEMFNSYGGAEDARAIVTAENWLTSQEAVDLIGNNGKEELCSINNMLGVTNIFIDCDKI